MAYQQPIHQPTMNPPVVVQPVVYPVQSNPLLMGLNRYQSIDVGKCQVPVCCVIFLGFFGFGFIVISLFMLIFDYAFDHGEDFWRNFDRTHSPMRDVMKVILTIGIILAALFLGLVYIAKRNKRMQESQDNTQPISEPFTQEQINQGSPYAPAPSIPVPLGPVPSGPGIPYPATAPSAPYSAQTSDVQQPYPLGFNTATGTPESFNPDKPPISEYDYQIPACDPPPYSAS